MLNLFHALGMSQCTMYWKLGHLVASAASVQQTFMCTILPWFVTLGCMPMHGRWFWHNKLYKHSCTWILYLDIWGTLMNPHQQHQQEHWQQCHRKRARSVKTTPLLNSIFQFFLLFFMENSGFMFLSTWLISVSHHILQHKINKLQVKMHHNLPQAASWVIHDPLPWLVTLSLTLTSTVPGHCLSYVTTRNIQSSCTSCLLNSSHYTLRLYDIIQHHVLSDGRSPKTLGNVPHVTWRCEPVYLHDCYNYWQVWIGLERIGPASLVRSTPWLGRGKGIITIILLLEQSTGWCSGTCWSMHSNYHNAHCPRIMVHVLCSLVQGAPFPASDGRFR